jgi:hypothetical protein
VFTHSKRDERLAKKLTTRILPVFMADGHFWANKIGYKGGRKLCVGGIKKKEGEKEVNNASNRVSKILHKACACVINISLFLRERYLLGAMIL